MNKTFRFLIIVLMVFLLLTSCKPSNYKILVDYQPNSYNNNADITITIELRELPDFDLTEIYAEQINFVQNEEWNGSMPYRYYLNGDVFDLTLGDPKRFKFARSPTAPNQYVLTIENGFSHVNEWNDSCPFDKIEISSFLVGTWDTDDGNVPWALPNTITGDFQCKVESSSSSQSSYKFTLTVDGTTVARSDVWFISNKDTLQWHIERNGEVVLERAASKESKLADYLTLLKSGRG